MSDLLLAHPDYSDFNDGDLIQVLALAAKRLAAGGVVETLKAPPYLELELVDGLLDLLRWREAVVIEQGTLLADAAHQLGAVHIDVTRQYKGPTEVDMADAVTHILREPCELVILRGGTSADLGAVAAVVRRGLPLLHLGRKPLSAGQLPAKPLTLRYEEPEI